MRAATRTLTLFTILTSGCNAADSSDEVHGSSASTGSTHDGSGAAGSSGADSTDDGSSEAASGDESSESSAGATPVVVPGLFAEYFAGYHARVVARVEPDLDLDWGPTAPVPELEVDRFSARWSGWLTPTESGAYTLITDTDDGVRLWVDDALRIDDWTPHFVTRNEVQVELVAGVPVAIRLEYFEIDLDASVRLSWSSATMTEAPIGPEHFTTIERDDGVAPAPPYRNPALRHEGMLAAAEPFRCADPGVIAVPDAAEPGYYAACTGGQFPIRFSPDLVFWEDTGASVLPSGEASWAKDGTRNWAPEIHRVGDTFVAYFTAKNTDDKLAIGAAVADDILGPYVDSDAPLVTHSLSAIDATYVEDEVGFLVYKVNGNANGQPTPIFIRELAPDGLSFAAGSEAVQLVTNDLAWEGGVVEAPFITRHDDFFYLFYAANVYDERYRTGVARASSVTGPYEKLGDPILGNNERWVGPGHGSVVSTGAADVFVYHAWTNAGGVNDEDAGRQALADRIEWVDGWPQIHDGSPSRTWQPWP